MDADEDVMAQLTDWAAECRERYRRLKEAGDQVTEGEKVEARAAYEASLERLTRFLADRRRLRGTIDTRQRQ